MQIVGVAGQPGAGRKTFAQALARHRGWKFVSLTDLLRAEARHLGQSEDPQTLAVISARWRATEGDGSLVRHAIEVYDRMSGSHRGLIVAPILRRAEADAIHALAGRIVWVQAPAEVRVQRLAAKIQDAPELEALHPLADVECSNAGTDLARFKQDSVHALGDDQCCAVEFD